MAIFVLRFVTTLAIVYVAEVVIQTSAAAAKILAAAVEAFAQGADLLGMEETISRIYRV